MTKKKDIIILKSDKCNTVVILDKCFYINVIKKKFNDNVEFSKFDILAGKGINHIIMLKESITSELKLLKNKKVVDKSYKASRFWTRHFTRVG